MKIFDLLPSAKIYKKILLSDSISVGTILIYYHKCTMVGISKDVLLHVRQLKLRIVLFSVRKI